MAELRAGLTAGILQDAHRLQRSFGLHIRLGSKDLEVAYLPPTTRGMQSQRVAAYSRCARSLDAAPDGCFGAWAGIAIDGSERRLWVEFGPHNRCSAPLPVGLSRLIPGHVTMQTKNMHDDYSVIMGSPPGGSILRSGAFGSFGWLTRGSTPAERLNMAFKFGKTGRESKSGCIKARYSISAKAPILTDGTHAQLPSCPRKRAPRAASAALVTLDPRFRGRRQKAHRKHLYESHR